MPLMLIIFIYLIDMIVNIFLFGIQKSSYMDWCLSISHNQLDEIVEGTAMNGTLLEISDLPNINIYNCQKLWEDELKFSLVIFLLMLFCYVSSRFSIPLHNSSFLLYVLLDLLGMLCVLLFRQNARIALDTSK